MREGIATDSDGYDAFYTVTKSAPTLAPSSGTITPKGGALSIYLHYYAIYESAAYTNTDDLGTLATEMQTEYYKRFQHDHFRMVFVGIHDYEPDRLIKSVRWSFRGSPTTEIATDTNFGGDRPENSLQVIRPGRGVKVVPEWGGGFVVRGVNEERNNVPFVCRCSYSAGAVGSSAADCVITYRLRDMEGAATFITTSGILPEIPRIPKVQYYCASCSNRSDLCLAVRVSDGIVKLLNAYGEIQVGTTCV